jgi:hypothetical protein
MHGLYCRDEGYLPILEWRPGTWKKEHHGTISKALVNKCLEVWLQPLKDMSYTGRLMPDPHGNMRPTWIRFGWAILDLQEAWDLNACTYQRCLQCKVSPLARSTSG